MQRPDLGVQQTQVSASAEERKLLPNADQEDTNSVPGFQNGCVMVGSQCLTW